MQFFNQVKHMKETARINRVLKVFNHLELEFGKENWKDVLVLAEDVISQLQDLAKNSGKETDTNVNICNMLENVTAYLLLIPF